MLLIRTNYRSLVLSALCLPAALLRGQVVSDGATNTLNNVTNTVAGNVTIGTNGTGTFLLLTNSAFLSNSLDGFIGSNPSSRSNRVWLTGTNTRWTVGRTLYVGQAGSWSQMIVSNGARVSSEGGVIGDSINSSNNLTVVTGTGSVWSNLARLIVGSVGVNNQLLVRDGGTVFSGDATISGANNRAVVEGPGSRLQVVSNLALSSNLGATNGSRLIVTNGGLVTSGSGQLGLLRHTNLAVVTGAGSLWSNRTELLIGGFGSANELQVSSGGAVLSSNAILGRFAGGNSNRATVAGPGSLWSNRADLIVGWGGASNRLSIEAGGMVMSSSAYLGVDATGSNNVVSVGSVGSLWSAGSLLLVGSNSMGNQLVVSNGGVVRNTDGTLGFSTNANNNVAVVTGAGSLWTNSGNLYIGSSGSGNRLVVSNGATVGNTFGYLGFNAGSSNNVAVVTGTNSRWINSSNFYIGSNTTGNVLLISDGGTVVSKGGGFVGRGFLADNNRAIINGAGSLWDTLTLILGEFGSGNQVVITNGGTVRSSTGRIGQSSLSSANVVTVTGADSLWANSGIIDIGSAGSENHLVVSNGGTVQAGFVRLGENSSFSTNNRVTVDGGTLMITNFGGLRGLDIQRGTNVFNSGLIVADRLLVTNGALSRFEFNGGTLVVRGGTNNTGQAFVVGAAGSTAATLDVRSNAPLTLNNGFTLGANTAPVGNQLLITNGGTLNVTGFSFIGTSPSSNNLAVVSGPGSLWTNSSELRVGNSGSGNRLVVSNGAVMANAMGYLGRDSSSSNNVALVTGTNSLWANSGDLLVGRSGSRNQLAVSDGGTVVATNGYLGFNSTASNNFAVVSGSGSRWTNSGALVVGNSGNGNLLVVSNGGAVFSTTSHLGLNPSASNNVMVVTDAGSTWTNSSSLFVDPHGIGNRLIVSNGGTVVSENTYLGANVLQIFGDQAVVTGSGSLLSNRNELVVGNGGLGRLLITNNGTVAAAFLTIGHSSLANTSSRVNVGGGFLSTTTAAGTGVVNVLAGTLDFNGGTIVADQLFVTNNGPGYTNSIFNFNHGTLTTTKGSVVKQAPDFLIGNTAGQTASWLISGGTNLISLGAGSNTVLGAASGTRGVVTVTGANTFWSNSGSLYVGSSGSGNQLVISNGAVVWNGSGTIGFDSTASNNVVTVTGTDSVWRNFGGLYVGESGSGNQLVVSNGGVVRSLGESFIGRFVDASNNVATVTGTGSLWTNTLHLRVGNHGSGNQLMVSNGGVVRSGGGYIGRNVDAYNNVAMVTGSGSLWTNRSNLVVGYSGSSNQLVVKNGGLVRAPNVVVGFDAVSFNNLITVGDGTLHVSDDSGGGALTIGGDGQGMLNFNGGTIDASEVLVTNGANSLFNFSAGTLNVRTTVVANTQPFFVGNGVSNATMNLVGNGTHSFANGLVISSNATLSGNGTIGGPVTNFGTIAPGLSPGAITFNGSLRLQSSSMLTFEISGLIATNDYDVIDVGGFVQFDGTLSLSLQNNFLPANTNTFTLISYGLSIGAFDNIIGGRVSLTNNLASFAVIQTNNSLVLGDVAYVDTDGDGQGDLQEQAAGTDPADPTDALQIISITENASGHKVIQFLSQPGKSYHIEHTTSISAGFTGVVLSPVLTNPAPGVSQWIDDGTLTGGLGGQRFYRIGLQ